MYTKTSEEVARNFVHNFILRYGIPKEITTDRGTDFLSYTVKEEWSDSVMLIFIAHHARIMVGFDQNDKMTTYQKLIAGCISGVVTRCVTQPVDVIKVRLQLQGKVNERKRNVFYMTKRIIQEEGVLAFWHGHMLGQVHSILAVSTQFYVYEIATKFISTSPVDDKYKPVLMFLCGSLAGACSATLVIPLEVIRVRQMLVKDQYRGFLDGAKMVYKTGGVFAFYEGLSASLIQMGPAVGISFSVFRIVQPLILEYFQDCDGKECKSHTQANVHRPEVLVIASTLAGTIAGFVSKTTTYPFDLAKKRLQIASHKHDESFATPSMSKNPIKCKKLMNCLLDTFEAEGIKGLYRGWGVTIYKAQLTSVLAFTSYELCCHIIREIGIR